MELSDELKTLYQKTANKLKGSDRRLFMAQVVRSLGRGGQRLAERELGWCRKTIRKGTHELDSGIRCEDNFSARGRKRAEYHLPNLLADIEIIVDSQSSCDPTFCSNRLYARISAAEVRRQLIEQKGYSTEELPSEETIRLKLNELGFRLRSVTKSRPKKKIPQTDAIFDELNEVRVASDTSDTTLRLSIDAITSVLFVVVVSHVPTSKRMTMILLRLQR